MTIRRDETLAMPQEIDEELARLRAQVHALERELDRSRASEKIARESSSEQQRAAQHELLESEMRFHHLVDAVNDYAIFMLDEGGHVATWNSGAKKTKGYEAAEIVGRHISVFYTAEDVASGKPQRILDTVRREGRCEDEGWRVRKDGTRFWANVVLSAFHDAEGKIRGFAKVTRDLTLRREAEENERKLANAQLARAVSDAERERLLGLLGQLPAIVNFLRGPDLVFEFVHPRATQLFGRHVRGKPFLEALPEFRDQPTFERIRQVYETGAPYEERDALEWIVVDGRRVESYSDIVYVPVRGASDAIEGVMTFAVDVTDSVRARRDLERASRAKDEFLATMSHELRTPLHAILGWSTILTSASNAPPDQAKLVRGLEIIERNARAQERLIADLLDMSRIISGKLGLSLRLVEIADVLRAAADVVRPAATAKGVRLVLDLDPDLGANVADPDRLQQVVWNLLTNAVRFTPREGRVSLTAKRAGSNVTIRVEDSGAGIGTEHLTYIFDRFRQIDSSTTRAHGGLGLGLAIVRHLVEAHGGTVEAHSEGVGHGATFTVVLPIRALGPSEREEKVPHDGKLGVARRPSLSRNVLEGVRALVVDDHPESLEIVGETLRAAGATVSAATSASAALAATGPFDVIVSDVGMPEVDGYSFIRSIRTREHDGHVPALALTAYARDVDAARALSAGFQEHLAKPLDPHRLVEAVRRLAGGAKQKA